MADEALPVQLQGHALARAALRLAGWTLRFNGLPGRHGVLIVYPHTSNWDFVLGILAKWAIGIVGQMARELEAARAQDRFLWLALSPEGTRRHAAAWRTGFYHVALQARVPVGLVFFDYGSRAVGVERFITLSANADVDLPAIERGFRQPVGKHPEFAAPVRFET